MTLCFTIKWKEVLWQGEEEFVADADIVMEPARNLSAVNAFHANPIDVVNSWIAG
jgi:hypothetical protein